MIIGAGMLGLTAAAVAATQGAASIAAVDPSTDRRQLSLGFGATTVRESVSDTGSCDVLLEFSGSTSALQEALATVDVQGVAVLAGTVLPGPPVALDAESVVRRQLSILGSHNYEPRHLEEALTFLRSTIDRFPWGELVAEPIPLAQIGSLLTGPTGAKPRYSVA